jgi:succinoglycan biosynthesis transport protein ExoP
MSRDYELLQTAEQQSKSTVRGLRRNISARAWTPDAAGVQSPVRFGNQATMREADWVKMLEVIRERWRLIISFAAIVITAAAFLIFWMRPEYAPSARLEIDPPGSETFTMRAGGAAPSEAQYLETQAQNLQTDDLAIAVIRKLRLDDNSDFTARVPTSAPPADSLRLTAAENAALRTFRTRRKVIHDPNSHMITVGVSAYSPQVAADITNTLAQTFVARTLKMRHDAIATSRAWLQDQLNDIGIRVEESNRDLAAFQKKIGVADIDEGRNTFGDLMTDLDRQTTQIQSERVQLESYLQKAKKGGGDSLPQIRENPVVQKLTQDLAEVRAQLSQDLVIYGTNHPNTKRLQSQALELERQLTIQRKASLNQLRASYEATRAREKLMTDQEKQAGKKIRDMAEYNILKKQAQAQASLYNSLLGRIEEAGLAAASQSSNIRVVDSARVLDRPTRPHRLNDLGLAALAGVLGGIVLAFLREKVDRPLRTPQDVRECTGVPSVSIIPEFNRNGFRMIKNLKSGWVETPAKFLLERPHSPESEAVRALNANIVLARGEQPQAVLVTSSLPGEGKTTVAVNLALALAQHGKTCLVDADLRRPCVAAACDMQADTGLGDVLLGTVPLHDAVVMMRDSSGLCVLPGGQASDERAHLIAAGTMSSVMESLRARFDFIVLDSAPIIPYAEGRALSTLTDGIIFVTRSGITPAPAMARSLELLCEVKSPRIVKIVLNAHDSPGHDFYYYPYKRY